MPRTGSVTVRALRLLESFTPAAPTLSLGELARRSGYPLTTVHRLTTDLLAWGALERDANGHMHIGLRLWEVASLAPRGALLREVAMPVMEDLSQITHENVQLGILDGHDVIFLERIAGKNAIPVKTRVGGRFPAAATGMGLALLAHADPAIQEAVLSAPLERFTDRTITDPEVLRRTLASVRRTEVAISDRQVTMDAVSVAAPIFSRPGVAVASVSLVVAADTANTASLAPLVRAAARTIGRALG